MNLQKCVFYHSAIFCASFNVVSCYFHNSFEGWYFKGLLCMKEIIHIYVPESLPSQDIFHLNLANLCMMMMTCNQISVVIIHVENVCVRRSVLSSICVFEEASILQPPEASHTYYFVLSIPLHVIRIQKSIIVFFQNNSRKC